MNRRHFAFSCAQEELVGTLDEAAGRVGLLIISGGNEIRSGAFGGQAAIAARVAAAGFPVFRFDRRGVGDSGGENRGFRESGPDIAAALAAFRRECAAMARVVGFGNCDAATALALFGTEFDAVALANPWTFDTDDNADLPAEVVRARYAAKLANPREIGRLLRGKVSLSGVAKGIKGALSRTDRRQLADTLEIALADNERPHRFLLASRDRTAQAFMAAMPRTRENWRICEGASHAFVEPHAREWLAGELLSALDEQARQLDMG